MNFNSNKKQGFVKGAGHQASGSVRDVDMVPMINVVFLLLTFFMIAGVFRSVSPVAVTLPETTITMPLVDSAPSEITIDAEGLISINGRSSSLDELVDVMTSIIDNTDWVVRADAQVSANSVLQVINAAKSAGFKEVGLQAVSSQ